MSKWIVLLTLTLLVGCSDQINDDHYKLTTVSGKVYTCSWVSSNNNATIHVCDRRRLHTYINEPLLTVEQLPPKE